MSSMSAAIEMLMNEHRVIEKVLGSLQTFAGDGGLAAGGARGFVADYARFFREFADRIHHAKEEDRLFSAMRTRGFPYDSGPLAVMLAEHAAGRAEVSGLRAVGGGSGPLSGEERARVSAHAGVFIPLLQGHIQKEDNILYPMAMRVIPGAEMEALAAEFVAFDRQVELAAGSQTPAYRAEADRLAAEFPPDVSKMAVVAGMGCGAPRPH